MERLLKTNCQNRACCGLLSREQMSDSRSELSYKATQDPGRWGGLAGRARWFANL